MAREWISEMHHDLRLDSILATMLRHHTGSVEEFDDAVEFCRSPFETRQLEILFRHMGAGLPLQTRYIKVDRKRGDTELRAYIHLSPDVMWNSGQFFVSGAILPETLALALVGRQLSDLLTHDYLPDGLIIGRIVRENGGNRWVVRPAFPNR